MPPMIIWAATGFYMVLFLAAMQSIPEDYYEAAKLDGSTFLVGGQPWSLSLPAFVSKPPAFALRVTPSYVADSSSSSGLIHTYQNLTGKYPLEILRGMKFTMVPKGLNSISLVNAVEIRMGISPPT